MHKGGGRVLHVHSMCRQGGGKVWGGGERGREHGWGGEGRLRSLCRVVAGRRTRLAAATLTLTLTPTQGDTWLPLDFNVLTYRQ